MIFEDWIREITEPSLREKLLELRQRYEFLSENLFSQYEPTKKATRRSQFEFMARLDQWLSQLQTDEQRRVAFRSIEYLFFAGVEEFEELYRCALEEVERWLMEVNSLDPFDSGSTIQKELRFTWFCPITDSLRINSFLHVTGISGSTFRPDWLSMRRFATNSEVLGHIADHKIKYLVLLEDFIGSGRQARKVLKYASSLLNIPILVVPLIICAPGMKRISDFANKESSVSVRPIVVLPKNCLVSLKQASGEPLLFEDLRGVMQSHYQQLPKRRLNGEYGFQQVGSMVVTYSNCPNNTPPLYHQAPPGESALFPRLARPWSAK